jgi:hypothetical protein
MRRRELPAEVRTCITETEEDKHAGPQTKRIRSITCSTWVFALAVSAFAVLRFVHFRGVKEKRMQLELAVHNQSVEDARIFLSDSSHEPVYGLTAGAYHTMTARCFACLSQ